MSTIVDDSGPIKTIRNLERQLTGPQYRRAFNRGARKGANVLKKEVRNSIKDNKKFLVYIIKRAVKVLTSRSRRGGVNITLKGPDVPVGTGRHRRFWRLIPYATMVFFGAKDRRTQSGLKRGDLKGSNNQNVFIEALKNKKREARQTVITELKPELKKEIAKARR